MPSTARRPRASWPTPCGRYVKAHDGLLLANHGALALGADLFGAYYKMETIEHFAQHQPGGAQLGREHLLSREEVGRLQGLRGTYGIAVARADLRRSAGGPDGTIRRCQVVVAPDAPGERLVAGHERAAGAAQLAVGNRRRDSANIRAADGAHRRGREAAGEGLGVRR